MEKIPMICLWQPWATAVVTPHPYKSSSTGILPVKRNETRSWPTEFRGKVLVHASLKKSKALDKIYNSWPFDLFHKELAELTYGAIIGCVQITDCITAEYWLYNASPEVESNHEEHNMGDFSTGRYAFPLLNPIRFDEPIPYKGRQGKIIDVPADVLPSKYQNLFL